MKAYPTKEELPGVLEDYSGKVKEMGAEVEIIGSWIRARFDGKPSEEIRLQLKTLHFRWNPKRMNWQYAGTPSRHTKAMKDQIAMKYGSKSINNGTLIPKGSVDREEEKVKARPFTGSLVRV